MADAKVDIWMPLAIGDYLKDTQHLDAERHGCYLLWLMHYWAKGPLPNDMDALAIIGKLRGSNAPSIAQALLAEFFTLESDNRWHQKRSDAEIAKWQGKRAKAQKKATKAAEARWGKDAPSIPPSNAQSIAQAMLEQCPSPSPSPKDLELSLLSLESDQTERLKLQTFPDMWNKLCGTLPKLRVFSDSLRNKVRTRVNQGLTPERFAEAVKACTEKPFLRGENESNWTATFEWLVKNDTNIEKAIAQPYGLKVVVPFSKPKTQYEIDAERQLEERREAVRKASGQ